MITKSKKKSKFETIFFSVLIGIFLLGTVGFLVISNLSINQKRAELTQQIEDLKKEIQALEEKNESLKAGIVQTESDAYWEEKLREQGYKKPGEQAIVVLPPEKETSTSTEEEKNIWEKFLDPIRNFFK